MDGPTFDQVAKVRPSIIFSTVEKAVRSERSFADSRDDSNRYAANKRYDEKSILPTPLGNTRVILLSAYQQQTENKVGLNEDNVK